MSQESTLNERTDAIYPSQTNTRYLQTLLNQPLTISSTALPWSKQRDPHTVYHLKRVFRPRALPSRDTQATPDNPPRDARVSDEVWECLQQGKAAAEAHEQEYKRLLEQEAALWESATAAERSTDSAAAATLEEATRHDADDEAKRHREEAHLRHRLERRAREAELEARKRKRQMEEERRRVAHLLRDSPPNQAAATLMLSTVCTPSRYQARPCSSFSSQRPRQMTVSRPLTNSGVSESFHGLKSLSNLGSAVSASSTAMEALLP